MPDTAFGVRSYKIIYGVLFGSTYFVLAVAALLLWFGKGFGDGAKLVSGQLVICGVAFLYVLLANALWVVRRFRGVAYVLIALYLMAAIHIIWARGLGSPLGVLVLGVAIVLSGMLLAARYALLVAIASGFIVIGARSLEALQWHSPKIPSGGDAAGFGEVAAYCLVLGVLALVSWLYNCEVERAFAKARTAGSELSEQKAAFKLKIKKRTKELRQSQLEEMRQMYRCAELGQYGVTLLHDLANHLTALNLEIEGLDSKQHAETIARAQRIIQHLGEVVDSTRDRLHGGVRTQTFNVVQKTSEVVRFLQYKASRADVAIDWQPPAENWEYTGDAACFNQVLNILIGNAIDAYDTVRGPGRVRVVLERDAQKLRVSVCDWGKGIPGPKRRQLFKPVRSTKEAGFGIGLFIAKQAVEMHFSGTIRLNPSLDYTEFIISLPRSIPKTNVPIANSKMNLIAQ